MPPKKRETTAVNSKAEEYLLQKYAELRALISKAAVKDDKSGETATKRGPSEKLLDNQATIEMLKEGLKKEEAKQTTEFKTRTRVRVPPKASDNDQEAPSSSFSSSILQPSSTPKDKPSMGFMKFVKSADTALPSGPATPPGSPPRDTPAPPSHTSAPTLSSSKPQSSEPAFYTIFVGGIKTFIDTQMIREVFREFGTIVSVKLFQGKGYAFVNYAEPQAVNLAISKMNKTLFNGGVIQVSRGRQTKPHAPEGENKAADAPKPEDTPALDPESDEPPVIVPECEIGRKLVVYHNFLDYSRVADL